MCRARVSCSCCVVFICLTSNDLIDSGICCALRTAPSVQSIFSTRASCKPICAAWMICHHYDIFLLYPSIRIVAIKTPPIRRETELPLSRPNTIFVYKQQFTFKHNLNICWCIRILYLIIRLCSLFLSLEIPLFVGTDRWYRLITCCCQCSCTV